MREDLYKSIIDMSPIGYAYNRIICDKEGTPCDYEFLEVNEAFEKFTGLKASDIIGKKISEVLPDALIGEFDWIKIYGEVAIDGVRKEFKQISNDFKSNYSLTTFSPKKNFFVILFTEIIELEKKLMESERSKDVLLSNLPGMAYRCNFDRDWTMQFVSEGCFDLTGYKAEDLLHNKKLSFNDLINPEFKDYLWDLWISVLSSKTIFKQEYEITTASGEQKWVYEQGQVVYDENEEVEAIEGIIIDITDQKKREDEIIYLNIHDTLTGLYNRIYFDAEQRRLDTKDKLPLSILIGDINGLKLTNDAFGYKKGDRVIAETAKILQRYCREQDVLARTGGGEFSILLPETNSETAIEIAKKMKMACSSYINNTINEGFYINITFGYCTKETLDVDFDKVVNTAEEYMYKCKLLEHKSSHNDIIKSIKATMFEKNQETDEHADRIAALSKMVGNKLNLSPTAIDELVLLAMLHDIGKVGIDERILNKPGKLNDEEWIEMKKHPEIGYRIAMASVELMPIAEFILCHQERWDGKGYPQGLAGEDIPVLSRIIAVVDAYDAMTQDRVYRKAMAKEVAINEIIMNAGTQFDPNIANLFVEEVLYGNTQS